MQFMFGNKTVIRFFFSLMSEACEGVSKTTHAIVLRLGPEPVTSTGGHNPKRQKGSDLI